MKEARSLQEICLQRNVLFITTLPKSDHCDALLLRFFVTCGNDGDVRIWEGLDDDDPKFITVGEKVYSLALKVGRR